MTTQQPKNTKALVHGGQLNSVALHYQIPVEKWLDLSTGISPISYPIPEIPLTIWQQLPQASESLITAAKKYYQTQNISVTSGSQAVIARLPTLFMRYVQKEIINTEVWLPVVGYKEHEKSWREAGFIIKQYQQLPSHKELTQHAIVVVINPNNPSGKLYQQHELTVLLKTIELLSGWLIVDEAFMDVIKPSHSVIHLTPSKHLFVLRSVGKFFGLAGIRIGFVSAHSIWLQRLNQLSSPWEVNGPAQFITEQALNNTCWQLVQQTQLAVLATKLEQLLINYFITPISQPEKQKVSITGCNLFKTLFHPRATELYSLFCHQGLYVRLCDERNALRFGIPNHKQSNILEKLFAQHCHSWS
jgi:cobalamin biosynthetic protein CobC